MRGIAIPFKYIVPIDLDYLDLHSKGVVVDGDSKAVIVLAPDDELMKSLERLKKEGKVDYRELTPEEVRRYSDLALFGD